MNPHRRFSALLFLLAACLVFLFAGAVAPKPKIDVVTLKVSPTWAIAPAEISIRLKVENPERFWCPAISIDIDDGAHLHKHEEDCDPEDEGKPHDSWVYFYTPMKGTRTRIFGPGEHSVRVTLVQGRASWTQTQTVTVIG